MEVSRKKGFRLSEGLAEGEADYFTKIVYQSSARVVNKNFVEAGEKSGWPGSLFIALEMETTIGDNRVK